MASPRIPYPELKSSRLDYPEATTPNPYLSTLAERVDKMVLEFDVEVLDAVFNKPGRYFIKMTIQSLATKDYSQILLRKWPAETYYKDHEAITSVVTQRGKENEPELCAFEDKKFTFRLPEGFCKHDRNHDVYLLVEAFSLPQDMSSTGKKCGEGKVAIYPRTNAPRTNYIAAPGEDMYRHTQVVSLLRTSSKTDKAEMHCGRMRCQFVLREYDGNDERKKRQKEEELRRLEEQRRKEEEAERKRNAVKDKELAFPFQARPKVARTPIPGNLAQPSPPPQQARIPTPTTEWADNMSVNLPTTPTPTPFIDNQKSVDSPLPVYDKSTYTANAAWRHTARPDHQQVDVIIHGASNLPLAAGGKVPQPFATIKTHLDAQMGFKARSRTHAVVKPTNAPSWEEMLTMDLIEDEAKREALTMAVCDAITRDELVNFSIPVTLLQPFHQYHVELMLPATGKMSGTKLYASITRKLSSLPKDSSSPNYLGLEVFLRAIKLPLQNPVGPIIAVARIVPDYYNYKSDNLLSQPRAAGVSMSRVGFPDPHPLTFSVTGRSSHGYPQLSLPGRPEQQPQWNHPYLFCDEKDKATMFIPSAALVIEYYVANSAMTDDFWKIQSPVGFSSLLLDQKVYKQLNQEKAKMGLRVENVPIMGSDLRSSDGSPSHIGMVLKLITTDQPESMVAMSNLDNLPLMEMTNGHIEKAATPRTPDVLQIKTPTPPPIPPEQGEEGKDEGLAPGMYLQRIEKERAVRLRDERMVLTVGG
ncbi:coiled-coil domain-containing protein 33-like [Plakobranchus ocellatus]|uniref:Coiled-coil domain-containing protein 33-like n=1 Tax=Plakobranchus ocellatus TaxID=259542 RepID=A0AAV4CLT4_9GAST|nr:coiled-coil domain-containing protein 33-like [Plakobranchus ocellatus]